METEERDAAAMRAVTARFFRGLGDAVRLRILELLGVGEMGVGEMVRALGLPQNQVSMHLGCLRWCGYVATRREGRRVYYRVADPRVTDILRLAGEALAGSEVYLSACDLVSETGPGLANVTGWRGRPVPARRGGLGVAGRKPRAGLGVSEWRSTPPQS